MTILEYCSLDLKVCDGYMFDKLNGITVWNRSV